MPRRGPAPKEPATRVRRNKDPHLPPASKPAAKTAASSTKPTPTKTARERQKPVTGADGWTSIPPGQRSAAAPKIPDWILNSCGTQAKAAYLELAKLPQAKAWLDSEWKLLQLALPLLERYLARPGSESFKALITSLSPALKLTTDDLAKARMRIAVPTATTGDDPADDGIVTDIRSRQKRLTG